MRVKFWGVRGSVPWATSACMKTGTNTACVEVADGPDRRLILDAGTGIVGVGTALGPAPGHIDILLSHYHWDHVQGLPSFAPFFQRGHAISVTGPSFPDSGPNWLDALFHRPYFPVSLDEVSSRPALSFLNGTGFTAGGFDITCLALTHPGGSMAYRLRGRSGDFVYATDHEFGDPRVDAALAGFASGAAAIVMDAQYTPDELPRMKGRGHGSWCECAALAAASGVGHLWLFHHQPGRTDDEVLTIESSARAALTATTAAREGVAFDI